MEDKETRKYASEIERRRKPLKDVDAPAQARLFKAAVWLAPMAIFLSIVGIAWLMSLGLHPLLAVPLGFVLGTGVTLGIYGIIYFGWVGGTVALLGRIYHPSGSDAPPPPTYWKAQALSVRGSHSEALEEYEAAAAADPSEPGPCLRAAALCIEELDDAGAAVDWYRRARVTGGLADETDAYVSVRLADLYEALDRREWAVVELRRLLQLHQDSPHAPGARARLTALKRDLAGEQDGVDGRLDM